MSEKVILVDANDTMIGEMEKIEAHKLAQLHRAVSVFVFNSKGQLLLQKRALNKYHSPGLWTNSACTHPKPGESNMDAAIRRLREEMGIEVKQLIKVFDFIYKEEFNNELTEYEFDHVFVGVSDKIPNPESSEVLDFQYIDTNAVLEKISKKPEKFTVWFKKIIERVIKESQFEKISK